MAKAQRRITALDVARVAGVSRTTVSYVLNDTPSQSIPQETRQRVFDAVRELNYVPLSAARALRRGRNDTVLLVTPDWPLGRLFSLGLAALMDELEGHGLTLLSRRQIPGRPLAALWREHTPAAVIALSGDEADEQAMREAGIFFARLTSSRTGDVVPPQEQVGGIQARYLAAQGHRHLGYAAPADERFRAYRDPRVLGARQACRDLGLAAPDVVDIDLTREAAAAAVRRWVNRSPAVTGVIAYNDEYAGALLSGLRELGLSAPGDLAVIGVDNEPLGRFISPSLTTVEQNHEEFAARVAQVVADGLAGTTSPMPPPADMLSLVVRESA
ncbi:LacI family DNA-binding transcriptional regulator [Streptomyces sp. NPDC051985]|uniref:LacI family DNA-binding transcriptional regulator n=1 Tax=Streptomyces sp. NPDC051985 TaxID=3155807 RepID=UPI00342C66A9